MSVSCKYKGELFCCKINTKNVVFVKICSELFIYKYLGIKSLCNIKSTFS